MGRKDNGGAGGSKPVLGTEKILHFGMETGEASIKCKELLSEPITTTATTQCPQCQICEGTPTSQETENTGECLAGNHSIFTQTRLRAACKMPKCAQRSSMLAEPACLSYHVFILNFCLCSFIENYAFRSVSF